MTDTALHFAPHPDDELIGAPATLMALRDAGWRVVNVACSLGRPEDAARREAELREACRLAGFELRLPERPAAISAGDDRAAARAALLELAGHEIDDLRPRLVVSSSPDDRHHGHGLVGEVVGDAIAARPDGARWWTWAVWSSLPEPTLATVFGERRLEEVLTALAAHRSQLDRGDYRRLVRARAEMNASLAAELLFGFGAAAPLGVSYAELLTEVVFADGRRQLGSRRWLDPSNPLPDPP